ncbi:MAG TPA: hypothetical protein VK629_08530 [Steroidobacteraceae bacterium]|nr:hypothetical protein [Steroidobacteraceae bacterium]
MKILFCLLGCFAIGATAMAQSEPAPTKNSFVRCTAVTFIVSRDHPDQKTRNEFKTDFESFTKFTEWLYPDNAADLTVQVGETIKAIQSDLREKKLTEEAFFAETGKCSALLFETLPKYMQCAGNKDADKLKECAR